MYKYTILIPSTTYQIGFWFYFETENSDNVSHIGSGVADFICPHPFSITSDILATLKLPAEHSESIMLNRVALYIIQNVIINYAVIMLAASRLSNGSVPPTFACAIRFAALLIGACRKRLTVLHKKFSEENAIYVTGLPWQCFS